MAPCQTKHYRYYGANEKENKGRPEPKVRRYMEQPIEVQKELEDVYHLPPEVAEHLSLYYGYRAFQVAELATNGYENRLHPCLPYIEAEVLHAIREEMAVRLSDVLVRRLRIAVTDTRLARKCLDRCLDIMKQELNWSDSDCERVGI